jgi:hypothetical protein
MRGRQHRLEALEQPFGAAQELVQWRRQDQDR